MHEVINVSTNIISTLQRQLANQNNKIDAQRNQIDLFLGTVNIQKQEIVDLKDQIQNISLTPGPMGPMGPAGSLGATGATGPRGPAGPAGNAGNMSACSHRTKSMSTTLLRGARRTFR